MADSTGAGTAATGSTMGCGCDVGAGASTVGSAAGIDPDAATGFLRVLVVFAFGFSAISASASLLTTVATFSSDKLAPPDDCISVMAFYSLKETWARAGTATLLVERWLSIRRRSISIAQTQIVDATSIRGAGIAALDARRLTLWTFGSKAAQLLIKQKVNRDRQGPVPPI